MMNPMNNDEKRRARKTKLVLLGISVFLGGLMLCMGNTRYTPMQVFREIVSGNTKGAGYTINRLRLPKLMAGGFAGFAFGVSGYSFQSLFQNSLASPDIIGVSAGCGFAAVFASLILGLSGSAVSISAFFGGLAVTFLIVFLSGRKKMEGNGKLILVGIGMQAVLNALVSWILLIGSEYDTGTALQWLRGSLNFVTMERIPIMAVLVVSAGAGLFVLNRSLRIMELGEEYAISLGVSTERVRFLSMFLVLIICSSATAVTGPIASVAFLSGPIAARLNGKNNETMKISGIIGVILVFSAELIGQNVFPSRYPVGVITGLLGAPYLLYLLFEMNRKGVLS